MKPYFSIQWHITDVCDQRCKHCYIFSEGHPQLLSTPREWLENTYTQIKNLCQRLRRTPYIYLTGGDPILHPDFWELLETFKADGTRFCVMSNPFHLTDETCRRMKDCGCVKYQLSLDGLEKTHDLFRKPGSFAATIKDIPNGVYLPGFFSNYPTQAAVDAMFAFLNGHRIAPGVGAVFPFSKIAEACAALDEGTADGKIVVTL